MSREIGSTLKPIFVDANGDAKATAFPKADVLGADANGNIKKTADVGNGLEISSGTLKVKAGSNVSVSPSGVAADDMRPLAGNNTSITDGRKVNVPAASESAPGVIKTVKGASFVGTDQDGNLKSAGTPEIWTFEPISGTPVPKTVLLES